MVRSLAAVFVATLLATSAEAFDDAKYPDWSGLWTRGGGGNPRFDTSKPDGAPLKALDSSPLLGMGWRPEVSFLAALEETYDWFLKHRARESTGHER